MLVVPAIDIRAGKCVRLLQGDYARETVFGDDPAAMASRWIAAGAAALHLVDLDGARSGRSDNASAVDAVVRERERAGRPVAIQLGGGIRDVAGIERWLATGVDRVILGTAAVSDPELVSRANERFPSRVWVGIDARAGRVAISGWEQDSGRSAIELAREMETRGAGGLVYTDIERDGTRTGVNAAATAELAGAVDIPVFASGGVGGVGDIRRLRAQPSSRIAGVIVGRALYDGAVTLEALLAAAED